MQCTRKSTASSLTSKTVSHIGGWAKNVCHWFDYFLPFIALFATFSQSNPNFGIFLRIFDYLTAGSASVLYHYIGLFVIGGITWVGALILFTGLESCGLITGFGIIFVHGWTLFLVPDRYTGKLRGGLGFEQGIHMYKSIRIICIIHSELAREFITTCMHHFYLVLCCSMGVWVSIKQIVAKGRMSILLSLASITIVSVFFF